MPPKQRIMLYTLARTITPNHQMIFQSVLKEIDDLSVNHPATLAVVAGTVAALPPTCLLNFFARPGADDGTYSLDPAADSIKRCLEHVDPTVRCATIPGFTCAIVRLWGLVDGAAALRDVAAHRGHESWAAALRFREDLRDRVHDFFARLIDLVLDARTDSRVLSAALTALHQTLRDAAAVGASSASPHALAPIGGERWGWFRDEAHARTVEALACGAPPSGRGRFAGGCWAEVPASAALALHARLVALVVNNRAKYGGLLRRCLHHQPGSLAQPALLRFGTDLHLLALRAVDPGGATRSWAAAGAAAEAWADALVDASDACSGDEVVAAVEQLARLAEEPALTHARPRLSDAVLDAALSLTRGGTSGGGTSGGPHGPRAADNFHPRLYQHAMAEVLSAEETVLVAEAAAALPWASWRHALVPTVAQLVELVAAVPRVAARAALMARLVGSLVVDGRAGGFGGLAHPHVLRAALAHPTFQSVALGRAPRWAGGGVQLRGGSGGGGVGSGGGRGGRGPVGGPAPTRPYPWLEHARHELVATLCEAVSAAFGPVAAFRNDPAPAHAPANEPGALDFGIDSVPAALVVGAGPVLGAAEKWRWARRTQLLRWAEGAAAVLAQEARGHRLSSCLTWPCGDDGADPRAFPSAAAPLAYVKLFGLCLRALRAAADDKLVDDRHAAAATTAPTAASGAVPVVLDASAAAAAAELEAGRQQLVARDATVAALEGTMAAALEAGEEEMAAMVCKNLAVERQARAALAASLTPREESSRAGWAAVAAALAAVAKDVVVWKFGQGVPDRGVRCALLALLADEWAGLADAQRSFQATTEDDAAQRSPDSSTLRRLLMGAAAAHEGLCGGAGGGDGPTGSDTMDEAEETAIAQDIAREIGRELMEPHPAFVLQKRGGGAGGAGMGGRAPRSRVGGETMEVVPLVGAGAGAGARAGLLGAGSAACPIAPSSKGDAAAELLVAAGLRLALRCPSAAAEVQSAFEARLWASALSRAAAAAAHRPLTSLAWRLPPPPSLSPAAHNDLVGFDDAADAAGGGGSVVEAHLRRGLVVLGRTLQSNAAVAEKREPEPTLWGGRPESGDGPLVINAAAEAAGAAHGKAGGSGGGGGLGSFGSALGFDQLGKIDMGFFDLTQLGKTLATRHASGDLKGASQDASEPLTNAAPVVAHSGGVGVGVGGVGGAGGNSVPAVLVPPVRNISDLRAPEASEEAAFKGDEGGARFEAAAAAAAAGSTAGAEKAVAEGWAEQAARVTRAVLSTGRLDASQALGPWLADDQSGAHAPFGLAMPSRSASDPGGSVRYAPRTEGLPAGSPSGGWAGDGNAGLAADSPWSSPSLLHYRRTVAAAVGTHLGAVGGLTGYRLGPDDGADGLNGQDGDGEAWAGFAVGAAETGAGQGLGTGGGNLSADAAVARSAAASALGPPPALRSWRAQVGGSSDPLQGELVATVAGQRVDAVLTVHNATNAKVVGFGAHLSDAAVVDAVAGGGGRRWQPLSCAAPRRVVGPSEGLHPGSTILFRWRLFLPVGGGGGWSGGSGGGGTHESGGGQAGVRIGVQLMVPAMELEAADGSDSDEDLDRSRRGPPSPSGTAAADVDDDAGLSPFASAGEGGQGGGARAPTLVMALLPPASVHIPPTAFLDPVDGAFRKPAAFHELWAALPFARAVQAEASDAGLFAPLAPAATAASPAAAVKPSAAAAVFLGQRHAYARVRLAGDTPGVPPWAQAASSRGKGTAFAAFLWRSALYGQWVAVVVSGIRVPTRQTSSLSSSSSSASSSSASASLGDPAEAVLSPPHAASDPASLPRCPPTWLLEVEVRSGDAGLVDALLSRAEALPPAAHSAPHLVTFLGDGHWRSPGRPAQVTSLGTRCDLGWAHAAVTAAAAVSANDDATRTVLPVWRQLQELRRSKGLLRLVEP